MCKMCNGQVRVIVDHGCFVPGSILERQQIGTLWVRSHDVNNLKRASSDRVSVWFGCYRMVLAERVCVCVNWDRGFLKNNGLKK